MSTRSVAFGTQGEGTIRFKKFDFFDQASSRSMHLLWVCFALCFALSLQAFGQKVAPGGPGFMIYWPRPDKDSFATTRDRPLWFTSARGVLGEIAYPRVDRVQTRESFVVIRGKNLLFDERQLQELSVKRLSQTLAYKVSGHHAGVTMAKTMLVHPYQDSVMIDYTFKFENIQEKEVVFIHQPTAEQTSGGDEMLAEESSLFAYQKDIRGDEPKFLLPLAYHSVSWSLPNGVSSTGFFGINSPLESLARNEALGDYTSASYGSVVGALSAKTQSNSIHFRVVISFTTKSAWKSQLSTLNSVALTQNFGDLIQIQREQWGKYLLPLEYDAKDDLAEASILLLKAAEDKNNPGALIAAPANPSLPWNTAAMEHPYEDSRRRIGDSNAGYRRIWPRDLYHKAVAFLAVGDYATAIDILGWFKRTQLRDMRRGSWPQNMNSVGEPSWNAFQIDQTGFPLILLRRLVGLDLVSYPEFLEMARMAAERIALSGPHTDQERWEENQGLSPNSLAVAIEGLLAISWLEEKYGSTELATKYLNLARLWKQNFKLWSTIGSGHFGRNYVARLEVGKDGQWNPNSHEEYFISNKSNGMKNKFREDEILDGGFLQWIITGLESPHDEVLTNTLSLYDHHVRKYTPFGGGYLRYNFDSYGENFMGGIWPILSAERALAAIERGEPFEEHLNLIRRIATPAGLIGEQDTLAVRPLEWSHAAYLILLRSIEDGRSFYRSM